MKTYKVVITEVLKKIVEVEADTERDALDKASKCYTAAEDGFVLYAEDMYDNTLEIFND